MSLNLMPCLEDETDNNRRVLKQFFEDSLEKYRNFDVQKYTPDFEKESHRKYILFEQTWQQQRLVLELIEFLPGV